MLFSLHKESLAPVAAQLCRSRLYSSSEHLLARCSNCSLQIHGLKPIKGVCASLPSSRGVREQVALLMALFLHPEAPQRLQRPALGEQGANTRRCQSQGQIQPWACLLPEHITAPLSREGSLSVQLKNHFSSFITMGRLVNPFLIELVSPPTILNYQVHLLGRLFDLFFFNQGLTYTS